MTSSGRLGAYLRVRRDLLQPEDVGLEITSTRRRAVGLRRQELAALAGISPDYLLRLEQGRDEHPSDQVIDALSRALRLDPTATAYLHSLARPAHPPPAADVDEVSIGRVGALISSWPTTAAVMHDRYVNVLAANSLAQRLNPSFRVGANSVLSLLLDPVAQALYGDGWRGLASRSVGLLRTMADVRAGDPRLAALATEGSAKSELFREFWERRDVRAMDTGRHVLTHPTAGRLELYYQHLGLAGTDGHTIFVYFAEPGSDSAQAVQALSAQES